MRLGSNRKTVAGKKSDVLRQLKDKNVTIFSEISQNVTLAIYYIILFNSN